MSWARGEVVGKWKGCSSFGFDALARPQIPRPSFSLAEIQSLAAWPTCHSLPRMFFPVLHAIKPFFMKRLSLAFPFQLKLLLPWLIIPCTSIQVITMCVCVCVILFHICSSHWIVSNVSSAGGRGCYLVLSCSFSHPQGLTTGK